MDRSKRRRNGFPQKRGFDTKKRVKENKVVAPVPKEVIEDDEEILSEEAEGIMGDHGDFGLEEDEERKNNLDDQDDDEDPTAHETADEARIRMAREIIERARAYNNDKEEEDDFFLTGGVQRDEEDDAITRALQLDHKKKGAGVFTPIADNVKKVVDSKKHRVETYTLKGHTKCATAIEVDSNGRFLFSVSKDGSLIKWDLEQQKKAVLNLGAYDKNERPVVKELLCASLSFDDKYLVTGGSDKMVRLWDARDLKLIETFKGHKDSVLGVKFKSFSAEFCSVGGDRVLKLWDAGERAFLDTFFGHKSQVNAIDAIGEHFVTAGFDRQSIYWKTEEGSQLLFKGGDYSLDSIKSLNAKHFVTGSQDGTLALWATNKSKPIYDISEAHQDCWMTALGTQYNTDLVISGSYNDALNFYKFDEKERKIDKIFELPSAGIVNDIKISQKSDFVFTCEGDEHRLGRWVTKKAKNVIKYYKIK